VTRLITRLAASLRSKAIRDRFGLGPDAWRELALINDRIQLEIKARKLPRGARTKRHTLIANVLLLHLEHITGRRPTKTKTGPAQRFLRVAFELLADAANVRGQALAAPSMGAFEGATRRYLKDTPSPLEW